MTKFDELRYTLDDCIVAAAKYRRLVSEIFPIGSMVLRDEGQYCVVRRDSECPIGSLALLHENGNIWFVPVTSVKPVKEEFNDHFEC